MRRCSYCSADWPSATAGIAAFLLGVAVFVAASAACGAATSVAMLVAFRILQAAGAALLTPTSLGLILASNAPERRQGAVRTWTAVGGLAAAAGPVIGGLLVAASWRWVFLVNVPIGLTALVVGWRRLPRLPGHEVPAPDALGAVLVTGGVGALALGLVKGGAWGWGNARTIIVLGGSAGRVVPVRLRLPAEPQPADRPLAVPPAPVHRRLVVALFFSAAFGAMLLSRVLWAQDVWHWSALSTGLSIAPGPIMVPLFSFLFAGRLTARFGPGPVIAMGSTIFAAGAAWWALAMGLTPDYVGEMLGGMLLTGIGVGLTLPDVDGDGRLLAAAPLVRDRLGRHQHAPADRLGDRRGGADRDPRLASVSDRGAPRLRTSVGRDRRDCSRRGDHWAGDARDPPGRPRGRPRRLDGHDHGRPRERIAEPVTRA